MNPNQNTRAWTPGRYCKHSESQARRLSTGLSPSRNQGLQRTTHPSPHNLSGTPPEEGGVTLESA